MTNLITAAMLLWPMKCHQLDRIAHIESGNRYDAVGDKGKSFGAWQMQAAAWSTANMRLKKLGIGRNSIRCYKNPEISRVQAAAYIMELCSRFEEETGRSPDWYDLYVMWNRGFYGYRRLHFMQARVPPSLAKKARFVRQY